MQAIPGCRAGSPPWRTGSAGRPVTGHRVKITVCKPPELELHDVIEVMKRNRASVCDRQRRLLGRVTRSKLVRILIGHTTQPRQPDPSRPITVKRKKSADSANRASTRKVPE